MLLALLLLAHADPPVPADTPAAVVDDPARHAALLWQGFDHQWLRRAFGSFVVPHRVSRFESRILDERHVEAPDGTLTSSATMRMAQSVGVDGDWMRPLAWWTRVYAPDVTVHRGTARFTWTDEADASGPPKAFRRFQDLLVVPLPPGHDGAAALQGIFLGSACADGEGACNSDGFWPYRFLTSLGDCRPVGGELACPLTVEVGRAWTPQLGGLRGVEVKPVSRHMTLTIDVAWVVLTGGPEAMRAHHVVFENAVASDQQVDPDERVLPLPGNPGYPVAATGLSSFGFTLFPATRGPFQQHRGRYIGGWKVRLRDDGVDPTTGVVRLGHSGGIFLPQTVARTGMSVELGFTTFQLGHPDAEVVAGAPVEGELCKDSGDQTPAFSRWQRCDRFTDGRERVSIDVPFTVP